MKLHPSHFFVAPLAIAASCSAVLAQNAFPSGVASGDVTDITAILWSRTTTAGPVRVQIAEDEQFSAISQEAMLVASAGDNFTIKLDADQLQPATNYFYRFIRADTEDTSPIGRFYTTPPAEAPARFRFVYSGDSNAADRPFRLLKFAADESPDLWFWAGDTIYGDLDADGLPPATDLDAYRAKHRQNREDPFLRDLLSHCPVWVQWDDHEVANDYDGGDIEPEIGRARAEAGQRAFFDYMPIRAQNIPDDPRRIYRSFRYGSLAEFFILDCRQYRTRDLSREGGGIDPRAFFLPIPEFDTIVKLQDPGRSMVGKQQLEWLKQGLKQSTATWKFVLSSVPFTSLLVYPFDRWDGYEAERYDLLRFIDNQAVSGVVLLSADIHANMHNPDVTRFQRDRLGAVYSPCFVAPEFVVGPIATETFRQEFATLGGFAFGQSAADVQNNLLFNIGFDALALRVIQENTLAFVEPDRYAYLVVDVGPDSLTATYRGIAPDPAVENPGLQTMYSTTLTPDQPQSCAPALGLPICLLTPVFSVLAARRRIGRGPSKAATCCKSFS